jgi:hypothetical protein
MTAWNECRDLERLSREQLRQSLFPTIAYEGRYAHISKGDMAKAFQATQGDYVFNLDDDTAVRVEHKCEYTNAYGNFFIETFSNKSRGNPGWFWKLESDYLMYHFMREGEVYIMGLAALRNWLYEPSPNGQPNIHKYPHKGQSRYDQKNDTWGYCVSVEDITNAIQVHFYNVPSIKIDRREKWRAA